MSPDLCTPKKLRILHVVASYLPATRYGGPIFSVHGLARAQAAAGCEVSVLTTNVDGKGNSDVPLASPCVLDGVTVWYFRSRYLRALYFSWAMRAWLKTHVRQFDVVHLHAVFLFPTNMAARVCIAAGVPYVIAPRGMLVPELIQGKSKWLKTAWIWLFERRTLARAACFHATSQLELDDARRLGVPVNNPRVIENGVALPARLDWAVPLDVPYVLYLGRLAWKKNLNVLIEACAGVSDLHLIIAGTDEENTLASLQLLCQTLGTQHRVSFLGELKGNEKWPWIQHARALALVSKNENFGNSAAEALSFGTPVLLSTGVGLAGDVARANAGWICEASSSEIHAALIEVMRDPAEAKQRGLRGKIWAMGALSWDRTAQKVIHMYQELA